MDEIEVIRTIEELRKFLNDKNFMELIMYAIQIDLNI